MINRQASVYWPAWTNFDGRTALVTGVSSGIDFAVLSKLVAADVHGVSHGAYGLQTISDARSISKFRSVTSTGCSETLGGVRNGPPLLRKGLVLTGLGVFCQLVAIGSAPLLTTFLDNLYRRLERIVVEDRAEGPDSYDSSGPSWKAGHVTAATPLLELVDAHRSFSPTRVLSGASLHVIRGEIWELTGGNGASMSSLAKVMADPYRPDTGAVIVEDVKQYIQDPVDAQRIEIETVFHSESLVPSLDKAEHVFLNHKLDDLGIFLQRFIA